MAILLIFWGAVFTLIFFLLSLFFKTVSSVLTNGVRTIMLTIGGVLGTYVAMLLIYLIYETAVIWITESFWIAFSEVGFVILGIVIMLSILRITFGIVVQVIRLVIVIIIEIIVISLEFLYDICYRAHLYFLDVIIKNLNRC